MCVCRERGVIERVREGGDGWMSPHLCDVASILHSAEGALTQCVAKHQVMKFQIRQESGSEGRLCKTPVSRFIPLRPHRDFFVWDALSHER